MIALLLRLARQYYKYSEIDLTHDECEEIVQNLISLVERKSFSKLVENIDEVELDDKAGIGLSELLEILSISKGAYDLLKQGGDVKAIKNASIIQRLMSRAGAQENMIEFVSRCKVDWDIWFREKRHYIGEFDLNFLLEQVNGIGSTWVTGHSSFGTLNNDIDKLWGDVQSKGIAMSLSKELILGAVFSSIVRKESR